MVAPAYVEDTYVDHELSANLDSTFAFEGPEKLLEIWFFNSESDVPKESEGLRSIPLEKWVKVLDLVSCKILSMKSSKFMDAYLLSESSLFVFPHKLILKTCGTTTTLACLEKLFETVNQYVEGMDFDDYSVHKIFYSRRSFMFPDKQKHVHRNWKQEVTLLNKYFQNGKSYIVGDFTGDDHWYLYMGGRDSISSTENANGNARDQTFEILMTELNPEKADNFITDRKPGADSLIKETSEEEEHDLGHDMGMQTMCKSKLDSIFDGSNRKLKSHHLPSPSLSDSMELDSDEFQKETVTSKSDKFKFIHDAFAFSPCGYSSNSISSNNGGYYYTLHITPESGWSYASFETNYPFTKDSNESIVDVLNKVLDIFQPGKFSVTFITETENSHDKFNFHDLSNCADDLNEHGYEKQERVLYDLKFGYKLLYLNFAKSKA